MKTLASNAFTKKDTNLLKGTAILLLLFHHLFYDTVLLNQERNQVFLLLPVSRYFIRWGFTCIFIFAALSGYGIASAYGKKRSIVRVVLKRELSLLGVFVPVYIICAILFGLDRGNFFNAIAECYGNDNIKTFFNIILDMLGLAQLVGVKTLNLTWWYMGAAHLIIFMTPLYAALNKKLAGIGGDVPCMILLWLLVLRFFSDNSLNSQYMMCLLASFTGVILEQRSIAVTVSHFFAVRKLKAVEAFLLLFLLMLLIEMGEHGLFSQYYVACLIMPFSFLITKDFLARIPVINTMLIKIGESSGIIYMTHTFVYLIFNHSRNFVFHYQYAIQSFICVLLITWGFAATLNWALRVTGYRAMLSRLADCFLDKVRFTTED